jgi:hypothetical protein
VPERELQEHRRTRQIQQKDTLLFYFKTKKLTPWIMTIFFVVKYKRTSFLVQFCENLNFLQCARSQLRIGQARVAKWLRKSIKRHEIEKSAKFRGKSRFHEINYLKTVKQRFTLIGFCIFQQLTLYISQSK